MISTLSAAAPRTRPAKPAMVAVGPIARVTGGVVALAAAVIFVALGFAWWWLLALFLIFDVSAVGYLVSARVGAVGYNLVHNYVAPAILAAAFGALTLLGTPASPLVFAACCWFFHVGVDRVMGYGRRTTAPLVE